MKGSAKDNLQLFTMCIPGIILLILFYYLPMKDLALAFKAQGRWDREWVGFQNFRFFLTSGVLGRLLKNTLGLNILFLLCNTVLGIVLALLLYEIQNRVAIKFFQTVIFLPFVISWVAASFALYANLADGNGIINSILRSLGFDAIKWYQEPKYWPWILLICYLWKQVGYGTIIYYGNLISIDKSYFEAAELDGASRWQIMRKIEFPFIRPIVITFFILSLGRIFNADFGMFYYLTKNSTLLYEATDVIDTYVYRALMGIGDTGMAIAINLLQSVIGFIILIISNWISKKITGEGALY